MNPQDYRPFYRRRLPHYQFPGNVMFVTFRLFGSIPAELIRLWNEDTLTRQNDDHLQASRRWFLRMESSLDKSAGEHWLGNEAVANAVKETLIGLDGKLMDLHAYCIMPNHAHLVIQPMLDKNGQPVSLPKIMQSIKGGSSIKANRILNRTGPFWEPESFDHNVRSEAEFGRIVEYVLQNPVKAGLVPAWRDWKFSFVKDGAPQS